MRLTPLACIVSRALQSAFITRRRRPHACNDGWITLGQLVVDPETDEETEEYALYLCGKCAGAGADNERLDELLGL